MKNNTMPSLESAVESFQLHDAIGNGCAAALYKIGAACSAEEFELYLHDFNSSIPRRFIGKIGVLKNRMDAFYDQKISEGFIQPIQGEQNQARIN